MAQQGSRGVFQVGTVLFNGGANGVQYKHASGTIASADITGTGAGQLGHANGVVLVPAAPAHYFNLLLWAQFTLVFSVAAYTGAGNTTVNIGGGGAALTGLISAANFLLSAASKAIQFMPLAAAPNVYTDANSLALVSAAAPTQPGTAASVIKWVVAYQVIGSGL